MYTRVIQPSERSALLLRPPRVSSSATSIPNTVVHVDTGANEDGLSAFLGARARMYSIAYRMLKSAAEAEDIVQEVWIRWQAADRSAIRNAAAFLAKTTTHLAINLIQSARSRRETSADLSRREAVETSADPALQTERREALQSAARMLLERLSPAERAAYVLREAFDYSYREIADTLRLEEANARQLVTRARQRVADGQHAAVNSAEQRHFLTAFVAAAQKGALKALESFFVGSADGTAGKDQPAVRTDGRIAHCSASSLLATAAAA